ncbi:Replication protein A 70 kDa DNA-binding subunit B [Vitis vinifera]|uniref:Replication protein A 70 kDa DNA-binding subunit B n=1 Tax=Vitis vinifera TaxID=29760 RepID=A0A438KFP9_VITVI|nr:Replication protein A 70 kDa DNA-binding subunit B [Vitis vinifera]
MSSLTLFKLDSLSSPSFSFCLVAQKTEELLDNADKFPIIAIKSLKVGDFQGVSLSTLSKSIALGGVRSMYYDRVSLSHVTSNPSLGEDKPSFFSIRAYISFIKPEQTMWYQACKTCNKKVTDAIESGYIMVVKVSDDSGEACLALFNEQAERIFGCSADELDKLKSQEGEENRFQQKLKEAIWVPHLFRISVAQHEYMNEKRQWITARAVVAVDFAAESRLLLEEISKMKTSQ